jgi:hypothetical protein
MGRERVSSVTQICGGAADVGNGKAPNLRRII